MSKQFSYHRPENLNDARQLLADDGSQPLLVHPRMDVEPYSTADAVVDLSLLNLNTIKQDGDVIRIGAMTTLQDVADSALLRTLARGILPEAASLTAHLGLRNVSTIGGVMMNPQSAVDVMLALLCLGVDVGTTGWSPLQTEISFSVSSSARAALERVARTPHDAPIVAVCILIDQEKKVARIAVGGVGIQPHLSIVALVGKAKPSSVKVAGVLSDTDLSEMTRSSIAAQVQAEVKPFADFRGSVEYQREMVGVLVMRAMKRVGE